MKITLADIAKRVGVTPSTVQRALNGVSGVSGEKREEIRRVAEEMGYRRNLIASSLKTGSKKIALVLPEPVHNNRYYACYLWEGATGCVNDHGESGIEAAEFTYVRTPGKHGEKLREVFAQHGSELDGILTMGTQDEEASEVLSHLREQGVPVVFVGTDAEQSNRLCCVRTYDEMAGRMAADLLIQFTAPKKHSKVVLTGDFSIADQFYNAQGFEKHIFENASPLEIIKLSGDPDLDVVKEGILQTLRSGLDIHAVYSTSARNTIPMCQAISEIAARPAVRSIGSDIFPESIAMAQDRTLNAIIHKRPGVQAYQAMQILINFVLRGDAPENDTVLIDPVIVMKGNLECYI